jgi:hypothetical protein
LGCRAIFGTRSEGYFCGRQSRPVLRYASSSKHDDNSIDVVMKDISRAVIVTLHYSIDSKSGIVAHSATIENREPKPIMIDQVAAAAFSLPAAHYTLRYLSGGWAGEWTLNEEAILNLLMAEVEASGSALCISMRTAFTESQAASPLCPLTAGTAFSKVETEIIPNSFPEKNWAALHPHVMFRSWI